MTRIAPIALLVVAVAFIALAQINALPATEPGVAEIFQDCETCPRMTWLPAGEFVMGSPDNERGRDNDEEPQHRVTIADAIAVSVYEITWDEWEACSRDGGCEDVSDRGFVADDGWGKGNRPVINVSWSDAKTYVTWLREITGRNYRLLSEAEWEYAARAGAASRYPFGEDTQDLCTFSNGADLATDFNNRNTCFDGIGRKTAPVGAYQPNSFGLYDMLGNVWEWTDDCRNRGYEDAPGDGTAWKAGDCSQRMLRGGSWGSYPKNLRSATRYGVDAAYRGHEVGFRVVRHP